MITLKCDQCHKSVYLSTTFCGEIPFPEDWQSYDYWDNEKQYYQPKQLCSQECLDAFINKWKNEE